MDYGQESLKLHERLRGKIGVHCKMQIRSREDLSIAYTPGVAEPCRAIHRDPSLARTLTMKGNSIAVVTDGSAVLGLGNIGPLAALPVMEGKALLFKQYADLDAYPICLATQDTDEIVRTVEIIAPGFGGINLEDISAPRCFEVEDRLQSLGIPVFHDDQHGTAIVVAAALLNACRVLGRRPEDLRVVVSGAGAAGIAIARMVSGDGAPYRVGDVILCDSVGALHRDRNDLNPVKRLLAETSNRANATGTLQEALRGADVFIGVSKGGLLNEADIRAMNRDPIVLAMANPDPEILPELAEKAGAAIIGTGRSDYPNQVNNVLAFPGIFRGALDAAAPRITKAMQAAAVRALADAVSTPRADCIIPDPRDTGVVPIVARAVAAAASGPGAIPISGAVRAESPP